MSIRFLEPSKIVSHVINWLLIRRVLPNPKSKTYLVHRLEDPRDSRCILSHTAYFGEHEYIIYTSRLLFVPRARQQGFATSPLSSWATCDTTIISMDSYWGIYWPHNLLPVSSVRLLQGHLIFITIYRRLRIGCLCLWLICWAFQLIASWIREILVILEFKCFSTCTTHVLRHAMGLMLCENFKRRLWRYL